MSWFMNTQSDRKLLDMVVEMIETSAFNFKTERYDVTWRGPSSGNLYHYPHLKQTLGNIKILRPVNTFLGVQRHLVVIGDRTIVPNMIARRRIRKAFDEREQENAAHVIETAALKALAQKAGDHATNKRRKRGPQLEIAA